VNVEALEAKREGDKLALECSKAECDLAVMDPGAQAAGDAGARPPKHFRGPHLADGEPDTMRNELLRIASRADESAENLMRTAGKLGVAGTGPSSWSGSTPLNTSPRLDTIAEPRDLFNKQPPTSPRTRPTVGSGNSTKVLDEAQRVLEKMDRLQAWRSPAPVTTAPAVFH